MLTIASFSKPEEAYLLKLRLEAGGVPAYVQDENLIQMNWLYSNAVGGVRVQIAEEDAEHANEILQEPHHSLEMIGMPPCPSCSSTQTAPDELPRRLSFLAVLLAGFPFMFSKTRWRCSSCNHTWNEPNKTTERISSPK